MAPSHDISPRADSPATAPLGLDVRRLSRYLPPDQAEGLIGDLSDEHAPPARMVEAFVHLACARSAIGSYLPHTLIHQLLDEQLESPWLRWVEGSLLFADLSGSTALAERLGALGREGTEMVTAFLNQIFTILIQVIQDYGGDLVSFGGDALLVFFGDERHPRTAARAALRLQEAMHGYIQEVPGIGSFPMHLHVGVESGRVAFVSAGSASDRQYSVLGATVNQVAAAEGYAQPNEVVVGPGAWATLVEFADGQPVGPGFYRISSMRAAARPHLPLPDEPIVTEAPELAIPKLLADLDRISPYIPPSLLRRIVAEPQRPQIEADLRPVSVLFAQALGLEALAEQLPPELAAHAVQSYVGSMQAAVEQFGGVVNKLDVADEGIKLVAIFGAPAADEDHAEHAARAALEMQARLDGINQQIVEMLEGSTLNNVALDDNLQPSTFKHSNVLRQRIGLNLGTAFAGNVGSASRKEYTVMGDAVNVAARVMSKSAWDEIWCSEATTQPIAGKLECEDRGSLALKGKALPVRLFRLIGERDQPSPIVLDERPLIGRDEDLAWLRAQLDAALSHHGRAVRISGDAGVGKSRLTAELVGEATARGVRIIPAACFSYTSSIPYAAWGEWLKALCGIVSGDDDALRARKIAARLEELGPSMAEWLPLLGDLVRLDVPENRLTRGLDPQMRQSRRFELLEQLLLRAAQDGPVLALFEDLHSADPISLDLWRRVAGALEGHQILLLGVHRPMPGLEAEGDGAQVLVLKELTEDQSGNLIAALAGDVALPEALVRKLVERADGNPLFLAELLRTVLERLQLDKLQVERLEGSKLITPQPSNLQTFKASNIASEGLLEDLPDSLSGILLSRIDRLDEGSRGVLRVASVIGQRIPFGVLHAIQASDQQALLRQLARLDEQEMTVLERIDPPERVHTFRHALIQEVAYQSMLYARRRELHGRIGSYLERRYADDLDDYYGLLAHHYRLSDRRDKAAEYLLKAGHAARNMYANDEAIQYYSWALDALAGAESNPQVWEARDALGDVYSTVGRYDEALDQHSAIIGAPGVSADAAGKAHRKRGNVLEKQGQYAAALEELDRAMAIARSGAAGLTPLAISLVCADVGLVHKRRGEYDLAIAACEEGLQAIKDDPNSFDDEKIEARLHSELGGIYGYRGNYPRAREHFEHSLRLRAEVDDLPGMAASHNNLGYLWQLESQYERAIEHYRVAEELATKINLRHMIVFAALNTASALISGGSYAEAQARCTATLALAQEMNDRQNIAQIHNTLGFVYYRQGHYPRSLAAYREALAINQSLGSSYQEANTLMNLALTLCASGQYQEAARSAREALERAEALHAQRLIAEALNALAEAALGSADLEAAATATAESLRLSQEIGSKYDQGVAQRLLGQIRALRGQPYDESFSTSIALFEAIKDRFELARTWAAYGTILRTDRNQIEGQTYLKRAHNTFLAIGANGELQRLPPDVERSV
ncbi:MAG TPA: adenylate/guanylate cyclase domain-containing protein [Roseiflexaceae bacterium]|nr:adenylate/guanylate cyclase domain-containing protein [Roseiflexaceae bacterium]